MIGAKSIIMGYKLAEYRKGLVKKEKARKQSDYLNSFREIGRIRKMLSDTYVLSRMRREQGVENFYMWVKKEHALLESLERKWRKYSPPSRMYPLLCK